MTGKYTSFGASLSLVALWFGVGTEAFISAPQLKIEGETVYFTRQTPFGDVTARWHSEIVVLDGSGYECTSGDWLIANYQKIKGNAVSYTIGDWALPCLARGADYTITTTRQAILFGVLPLRPMLTVDLINVEKPLP